MTTMRSPRVTKAHSFSKKDALLYAAQDPSLGPIMLVRVLDWQDRFVTYVRETIEESIKCDWVFNHCAGWAAGGVQEMTSYDFFEPFQDYPIDCPEMAYKAIRRAGFDSLEQYISLTFIEKPIAYAQRGDLVMVSNLEGDFAGLGMSNALGLADPPSVLVLGTLGLGRVPLLECPRCFAVGETM